MPILISNVFLKILLTLFLFVLRVITVPSPEILKPSVSSFAFLPFTVVLSVNVAPVTVIWYTPEGVAVTFTVAFTYSSSVKPISAFPPVPTLRSLRTTELTTGISSSYLNRLISVPSASMKLAFCSEVFVTKSLTTRLTRFSFVISTFLIVISSPASVVITALFSSVIVTLFAATSISTASDGITSPCQISSVSSLSLIEELAKSNILAPVLDSVILM